MDTRTLLSLVAKSSRSIGFLFPSLVIALLTVLNSTAQGQVPLHYAEWGDINYRDKIVDLCDTHIKNHRVRGTHKTWELAKSKYQESKTFPSDRDEIYGESAWIKTSGSGGVVKFASYLTPDAQYFLVSEGGKLPFKLREFDLEWKSPGRYSGGFEYGLATIQIYSPSPNEKIQTHETSQYEGQDSLKLVTKRSNGIVTTIHLALDTYQLLYSETDKSPDFDQRGELGPEKHITRVTYRVAGNKRLPVRSQAHVQQPDGKTRNYHDHEITEYVAYTPTADELDLEKRFGVKPIPHEPRPASAMPPTKKRSGARVWYMVGGGLAVFTAIVGIIAFRRKNRRADS